MTEIVSVARDGPLAARRALEQRLAGGGVAIYPADGVYAIGCDPARTEAIERIHVLKGRDDAKPSAVMFFSPLAMRELVGSLGPRTRDVLGALLPGPVTLVVANPEHRYPHACREDPERLGVRLISGPLEGASCAVFQTSANLSGEATPSAFEQVSPEIADGADLAIDGGALGGLPSTVVDLTAIESGGGWRVLREGAMPAAELARRLDSVGVVANG